MVIAERGKVGKIKYNREEWYKLEPGQEAFPVWGGGRKAPKAELKPVQIKAKTEPLKKTPGSIHAPTRVANGHQLT